MSTVSEAGSSNALAGVVHLNTKNHVRVIKAGFKVSDFVNDCVENELDRLEQKEQGEE